MNLSSWEKIASKLLTSMVDKPSDNFHSVVVDVIPDKYGGYNIHVTYLFKTFFKMDDSDIVHSYRPKIAYYLKEFLPKLGDRVHISQGSSTIENYETLNKPWYEDQKNEKIDESVLNILKELNNQLLTEASKKKVLVDKVGLSEENADFLDKTCGSLAVWMANKVIEYQINAMKSWRTGDEVTKQSAIEKINSGNMRNYYGSKVTEIMDWIRVGLNGNVNEYKNLSLIELGEESKKWHDSLGIGGGVINYNEENPIIKDFRDKNGIGFYWADLQTNDSKEECERMGHCGRTGYGNIIYSLRETKKLPGDKYTINKSHLTASIGRDGTLYQLKGPKNSKPKEEYHNYILPLFYVEDEDDGHLIQSFGSEYASDRDFKLTDLPNDVLINLYENRPDLFDTRSLKRKLADLGVIDLPEINYHIKIETTPEGLGRYVDGDWVYRRFKRKIKTTAGQEYEKTEEVTMFEIILAGDTWDLWDNHEVDWKSSLQYNVDNTNEQKIRDLLKYIAQKENPDFDEDLFNNEDIEDLIEDWDDDYEIRRAISSATSNAEADDYSNYLYNELKSAIEEYGTIEKMDDSGVIFNVNAEPYINDMDERWIDEYMERCDDDIECVFDELASEGEINKPRFNPDERWYPSVEDGHFNEMLSEYLSEAENHYIES
jgi:hypothetical protein